MTEPAQIRYCFGCKQPIEGDAGCSDFLSRTWHYACYEEAAEGFLADVKAKPPRHV